MIQSSFQIQKSMNQVVHTNARTITNSSFHSFHRVCWWTGTSGHARFRPTCFPSSCSACYVYERRESVLPYRTRFDSIMSTVRDQPYGYLMRSSSSKYIVIRPVYKLCRPTYIEKRTSTVTQHGDFMTLWHFCVTMSLVVRLSLSTCYAVTPATISTFRHMQRLLTNCKDRLRPVIFPWKNSLFGKCFGKSDNAGHLLYQKGSMGDRGLLCKITNPWYC